VHVYVTHPDGEADMTEVMVPESATPEQAQALVTEEIGGLLIPDDVVALNYEDQFAPFAEFTTPHVIEADGHMSWCERNCDTTKSGEHACVVFERDHS